MKKAINKSIGIFILALSIMSGYYIVHPLTHYQDISKQKIQKKI